jgi:hypothetical protein
MLIAAFSVIVSIVVAWSTAALLYSPDNNANQKIKQVHFYAAL